MNPEEENLDGEQVNEEENTEEENGESNEVDPNDDSYRGKLNATNRFLQSQGYVFEKGKGWVKPNESKPQVSNKNETKKDIDITPKDTLAFIGAGITEVEDVEEVIKLAKAFNLSVADALKDQTIKHRLNVLKEQRKTAEATNTRSVRSGNKQPDSRQLLENLSRGEIPTGRDASEELFWARRGGKRK